MKYFSFEELPMEMFREKIPLHNLEVRSINIIFKEIKIRHDFFLKIRDNYLHQKSKLEKELLL